MFDALKNSMFREVNGVVWDMQSGQLGVQSDENGEIVTLKKNGRKYELVTNPLADFSVTVPAWAVRTPVESISTGDLVILSDDTWGFFVELVKDEVKSLKEGEKPTPDDSPGISNPRIKMINVENGSLKTVNVASNALFGTPGLLVVRNIVGDNEVANSLPILMMIEGKKGGDIGRLVAMSMMMQNNGTISGGKKGVFDMQQMLPLMMLGGQDSKMKDFFMMQALMGGNGNGGNGLQNLMPFMMMDKIGGAPQ